MAVGMEDADSMDGEDDEWVAEEPSWDMEGKEDAGDTDIQQVSSQLFNVRDGFPHIPTTVCPRK